ncbi:YdfR family protein [Escherichia coli]|nr:YdfR family protein [Escherichia coli]HAV8993237.1 YdfR family protein [Escherichia coli]HAV9027471.1 YdfR family protein [Escherichia coli]HAW2960898.1 YdfR family protein [Escherichia coli]HAW4017878.1 YdfR family protein [Escherichia coli]
MIKSYELIVKGTRNFENKVSVIVTLQDKERFAGEIVDLNISMDRVEGATLEFYEAEAIKQAKTLFRDIAAGLCEGNEPSPEKRPIILEAQDVLITYKGKLPGRITGSLKMPPSTLRSEKDDIESLIEKLEGSVADLNKKLSVLIPSEDEKKRRDEHYAAIYDYCHKVAHETFMKFLQEKFLPTALSEKEGACLRSEYSITVKSDGKEGSKSYFIASAPDKDQKPSRPFMVSSEEGEFVVYENGKPVRASHHHCLKIINLAIRCLKDENTGVMKRIGRCMGYLQVAAEIEALASGADMDAAVREALLRDFNTPPFKKEPDDWIQPGLTYLKRRI